jgi:pimeloyl-ACP methyl ester carboxylesterase
MGKVTIFRATARLGGIDIFYRDTRTAGPAILCLHGRWGRGETWIDFMRHYGEAYRIIAPDQRGHGLSGKPVAKYTTEEMAGDMIALLDSLGIESSIVVGHSMGGTIAGYMAASYPERVAALAILDKSASGPEKPDPPSLDKIGSADPLTKDWPMPFSSLVEAQEFLRGEMKSDLSYQYFMNSLTETAEGYRMMFSPQAMAANIAHYESWFDLLPRIRCPTLVIRARGGEAVADGDFARMKSMLADCAAHTMSSSDHNVHLSDKKEFYGRFDEFLKRL